MSDTRWERLQFLFDGLLERAPAERESWLAEVEPDIDLRAEALALVAAERDGDEGITRQLREAAVRASIAPPASGRQLGPYRLTGEIGSGGMAQQLLPRKARAAPRTRVRQPSRQRDRGQWHLLWLAETRDLREVAQRDTGGLRVFAESAPLCDRSARARRRRRDDRCVRAWLRNTS